jgi:prolyl-tRNA synthetase
MRAKEFIMKDAYSFDTTDEGPWSVTKKCMTPTRRIFARCGLKAFPVEADTGVIGGNYSHEFMIPAETGENEVAFCEACGYAANVEKATSGLPKTAAREIGAAVEKFATPGVVTIEALSKAPYSVPANRQIKTLVYVADSKPVIILIRGDDQLNETKFMAKTGAVAVRPATPEEIQPLLGAKPGSLGAVVMSPLRSRSMPTNVCRAPMT